MRFTLDREIEESNFIGIINLKDHKEKFGPYNRYMRKHLEDGGGIIYVNSIRDREQGLKTVGEVHEAQFASIYGADKTLFIFRENYLKAGMLDVYEMLRAIEQSLDQLKKDGCKRNWVYINRDQFWNSVEEKGIQSLYDGCKNILETRDVKFIFRYILRDIDFCNNMTLLLKQELLVIEKGNDAEYHTPMGLINQSLIRVLGQRFKDDGYEEDRKRTEHVRVLGDIIEGAVHDVNNLLATIAGYVQLSLEMDQYSEVYDYLQTINRIALDGRNVIGNIRNYVRGYSINTKAYHNFDNIINNCIMMAKYKFKSFRIKEGKELKLDVSLGSKAFIYGNEYEIRQSILNIMLNGIDAMGESGTLSIRTYDNDRSAVVDIIDTGTGISKEDLDRIFEPYYTTKSSAGTGLGLNIVNNMLESHNGEIHIESELGKGSKFTLSFPLARYRPGAVRDIVGYSEGI